jgi:hypothetical protein
VNGDKNFAKGTTTIAAGSTTGFASNQAIFHLGPALAYMAKVPARKTAATCDGSGIEWFKTCYEHLTVGNGQLDWPSYSTPPSLPSLLESIFLLTPPTDANKVSFKIPAATPPGDYLLHVD